MSLKEGKIEAKNKENGILDSRNLYNLNCAHSK